MVSKLKIISILLFSILASFYVNAKDNVDIKAGVAFDMGFGVTALINEKLNISFGDDGIAADYHLKKGKFKAKVPFTWYVAGGAFNEWGSNSSFGARLPLGLNINFRDNQHDWNAYTQIAPDIDLSDQAKDLKIGAQFAVGIRYSF